jgi:FYVE/RhoGEF/PH domain-containing protein 5/6
MSLLLQVCANDEGSQMSGHLRRRQRTSKWKRGWLVLKDRVLYVYRASEDTVAIDTLPVLGWQLESLAEVHRIEKSSAADPFGSGSGSADPQI